MRTRFFLAAALITAAAACNNPLDVKPAGSIPESSAITDAVGARAALFGAYGGLQSLSYYGEDFPIFLDLSADNSEHTGTLTSFGDADLNELRADNETIAGIWIAIYDDINRANEIIAKVPQVPDLDPDEMHEIIGEAYFLRALNYHNLVKLFGGVPLRLTPATSINDPTGSTRASVADTYTQILKDLDSAQTFISNPNQTTQASLGAVMALRARVLLYEGDYPGALTAAKAVEDLGQYSLAPNFSDLFAEDGSPTPEDIFRIIFTAQQFNNLSFYYLFDGRYEVAPTTDLMHDFDPSFDPSADVADYDPVDTRGQWSISIEDDTQEGTKFRSVQGTEFPHVIRFGEVLLIRAEAEARVGSLDTARVKVNEIRARAGLAPIGSLAQTDMINTIIDERRKELAFEGDRWPDLVRLGLATTVLGISAQQALYPIPQREIDVTPGLAQNPGY
ncbi:MAG TPA: RagB/SusD family nutrient uptake outer membrane protein [Gemmatimonadaceae bacterium]|nr:RagB/SusD family nutrient uptake outer membrane protein [Gemmatimonadaceae bacterium]